jgi:hypothetical protein
MKSITLSPATANLELEILNAEAESTASSDIYAWLRESGLPSEVAIRLTSLVENIQVIGGRVVSIGKIVLIKIIEFCRANPNLSAGVAVGAAVSALVLLVPLIGSFLAPIALALGITIGAVVGYKMDRATDDGGDQASDGFGQIAEDLIEIAKKFFALFCDVINAVSGNRN